MPTTEEKLAQTLTANTVELIPYLSYLLQDLWELGSSPKDMVRLLREHVVFPEGARVLDLACGKGAVAVALAKEFGVLVKGIDLMPEFVAGAKEQARAQGVEHLCQFVCGDVTALPQHEKNYDLVVLGAVGDLLGSPEETLRRLRENIKPGGYILIDDAYGESGADSDYHSRNDWLEACQRAGVGLIAEQLVAAGDMAELNTEQQGFIVQRAHELMAAHPDKRDLFEGYIASQQEECDELESTVTGVTLLLQAQRSA